MNNEIILEKLNIHNLPNMFSLYFETAWQDRKNFKMFIVRLGTQIASRSKYEHIANVIKCPVEYDGCEYIDNRRKIIVKAGEWYVFEATHYAGFIITPLKQRLLNPIPNASDWSGNVDLQIPIEKMSEETLESVWLDATSMLCQPYAIASAFFSAFDQISFISRIRNMLGYKFRLTKGVFCSMFSIINWWRYFDIKMDKELARNYTPEEVLIFLLIKNLCSLPIPLLKFKDGNIIGVNSL